jgi:branched-chain amino acid transport system ATP-binding protein
MLEISGLSAGYEGRAVIHGIDLQVRAGEIVALVGANGAGKSTLARTLSGLLPALGGRIRLHAQDVTFLAPAARVRAGLIHVPEGRQIFAGLTVAQNIELGSYIRRPGETEADLAQRLRMIYRQFPVLEERASAIAGNLSGGQQQMLAIARALMAQPRLLILDEPSLGLSPSLVTEIFRLITSLRAQGIAILLSEQNARMSLAIADRGYVLENGRVVLSGEAAELRDSAEIAGRYLGVEVAGQTSRMDQALSQRLIETIKQSATRAADS